MFIELSSGTIVETRNPSVYDGPFLKGTRLSNSEGKRRIKEQAQRNLFDLGIKAGDRVYCVLRRVSASGMSRNIDFYIIKNNEPLFITGLVANLLGLKRAHEGLTVKGCGMDMGFATVYNLGAALWPDGTKEPHGTRNGQPDTDGGYALNSSWI